MAHCNLGIMFDQGNGVAQSGVEAALWYRKAAD
jgi:TPR repeat protein